MQEDFIFKFFVFSRGLVFSRILENCSDQNIKQKQYFLKTSDVKLKFKGFINSVENSISTLKYNRRTKLQSSLIWSKIMFIDFSNKDVKH